MILVRHLRPRDGEGRCYGASDLAPGPELDADAARLQVELAPVDRVVSSPLVRARALAEALAERWGARLILEPRLTEMDFGRWENRRWDELPRAELDAWDADLLHARPHGGESVAMLAARVDAALTEHERRGHALFVTHMGVIRAALARAGHPDPWQQRLGFAQWLRLEPGRRVQQPTT